jgi:hypothetical protein
MQTSRKGGQALRPFGYTVGGNSCGEQVVPLVLAHSEDTEVVRQFLVPATQVWRTGLGGMV